MSSLNKVQIIGRLGADPELKYTTGGKAVCSVSVATSKQYKDANGKKQEKTEWHRLVAWERTAELCGEYLKKGHLAYFEGELKTREYEKNGEKRYSTEIVVQSVQFLVTDSKPRAPGSKTDVGASAQSPVLDDDIPF